MIVNRIACMIVLVLAGWCQAELLAPQMPRTASEKGKDTPAPPRLKWEIKQLSDNLNEGVAVFDVNKDGKLDITAGPNWYAAPDFKPHPLRKMDDVLNDEYANNNCEHGYDVNADGWIDVIAGSWFSDKIYWYENPGKQGLAEGKPWEEHFIAEGLHCHEGSILTDVDGDKHPELVINSWSAEQPMSVVLIEPDAEPKFQVVNLGGPGTGHGIVIGDINGDARVDFLVPKGWFEQPAEDPWSVPWKFHASDLDLHHTSVPGVMVDLDGDGKNDAITGHAHGFGLFWLEQTRSDDGKIAWTRHDIDDTFSQMHHVAWADLDGDGKPEAITGKRWRGHKGGDPGAKQPLCIYRYIWNADSKSFDRDTITYDAGIGTGMQIHPVDMDGDGKLDLVVAGKTGTYILYNRGPRSGR